MPPPSERKKGHSTRDRCDVEGPALGRHLTKAQPRRDASAAMISFNTNMLVYAAASISDVRVMRARDLVARATRTASCVLLLQALAELSSVAIRKARIPVKDIRRTIDAWRAVLPVQAVDEGDLWIALDA